MTTAPVQAQAQPPASPPPSPAPASPLEPLRAWFTPITVLVGLVATVSVALAGYQDQRAALRELAAREEAHEKAPSHVAEGMRLDALETRVRTGEGGQRELIEEVRALREQLGKMDRRLLATCLATARPGTRCE